MELYEKTCNWFREGTDFMELTKEKALELHRQLWNYIADESEKQERIVSKVEAFIHFGWPNIRQWCWCCEYAEKQFRKEETHCPPYQTRCSVCPVVWNKTDSCCVHCDSPYNIWNWLYEKGDKADWYDLQNAIKYAREIANLPERKE